MLSTASLSSRTTQHPLPPQKGGWTVRSGPSERRGSHAEGEQRLLLLQEPEGQPSTWPWELPARLAASQVQGPFKVRRGAYG